MSAVKEVPKIYRKFITIIVATTVVLFAMHSSFAQDKSDNNFEFKLGPNNDGFRYTLNFQPVIPFSLNKDWNLITRTIVPYIYQDDVIGTTDQSGLSDIEQSFFFSPQKPVAGIIVGAERNRRPARRRKMGSGPTIVLVKQEGRWTFGLYSIASGHSPQTSIAPMSALLSFNRSLPAPQGQKRLWR